MKAFQRAPGGGAAHLLSPLDPMEKRTYSPIPDASGSTTVTIGTNPSLRSPSLLADALTDGTPVAALLTSLVVGSLLLFINHYNDSFVNIPKTQMLLTYMVPYVTYTIGAVSSKRKAREMLIQLQRNYDVYSTPSDHMIRQKSIATADFIISPTPMKLV